MLIRLFSSSYSSASSSLPVGNKLQINAAHARKMNPVCSSMHVQTCTQLRVHGCVCTYSKLRCRRQSKTKAKLLWASSCCCFCFVIRNCFEIGYTLIPRSSEVEANEWVRWKLCPVNVNNNKLPALSLTTWSCSHALMCALCLTLVLSLSSEIASYNSFASLIFKDNRRQSTLWSGNAASCIAASLHSNSMSGLPANLYCPSPLPCFLRVSRVVLVFVLGNLEREKRFFLFYRKT